MNEKYDLITTARNDKNIFQITLNRPEKGNAYNAEMIKQFDKLIDATEKDDDIRVVILTGAGNKSFCSGADLTEVYNDGGKNLIAKQGGYQPLQNVNRQKLWIAALNGNAFGGGFELALHCDFIFAVANIKLGLPEVKYSLLPAGGGIIKLVSHLPVNVAREIILSGEPIALERAYQLGIVNKIVSRDLLLTSAINFALTLCKNAPLAVRACNRLIEEVNKSSYTQWLKRCEDELLAIRSSEDYANSQTAFKEKRFPVWQGK